MCLFVLSSIRYININTNTMRCYGCECVCMHTYVCMCVRGYACVYVYVNVCGVVSFSRGAISVILSKHG